MSEARANASDAADISMPDVPFREALAVWGKIGLVNFGGPAGQIALMHKVLVEERRWIDETRFLHALNYCMLLPGPEAQQLATYVGWLMHGVKGGLAAGLLFILPGFVVMLALSTAYVLFGDMHARAGHPVRAQGGRARNRGGSAGPGLAPRAEVAGDGCDRGRRLRRDRVFQGAVSGDHPRRGAGRARHVGGRNGRRRNARKRRAPRPAREAWGAFFGSVAVWGAVWLVPVALLAALFGMHHVFTEVALFFSKVAVVTFGGAYAVLAYVAQQAVEVHHWLRPDEMLTGLGLAETTPGPLILVLVFVGFLAGFRGETGLDPLAAGLLGGAITLWVTFAPSFLFIFAGAPFIEQLRGNRIVAAALAAVTAAVVGVIANLAFWFGLHVLFAEVGAATFWPVSLPVPALESFDPAAALIAAAALVAVLRLHMGIVAVLALAALAGMVVRLVFGA